MKLRQVIEYGGYVGMVRSHRFLPDRQGPAVQRLGLGIAGAIIEIIPGFVEQTGGVLELEMELGDPIGARLRVW